MSIYIGLMSGTSMDGIDAALVDIDTHQLIAGITRPYSAIALQFLHEVISGQRIGLHVAAQLNRLLGLEFAAAVHQLMAKTSLALTDVTAIGNHGQTLCHDAMAEIPYTLQLGCSHTIAESTGKTVVADFRTRDLVLGGQGAPFAPLYHQVLFGNLESSTIVVNIGGIANVTFLEKNQSVLGFDTGPGNCLMDFWVKRHLGASFDHSGKWASSGQVIPSLLQAMQADPYFMHSIPKSIGKEYFAEQWLNDYLRICSLEFESSSSFNADVQATLLELTAITIANAIKSVESLSKRIFLCGGGAHNAALCAKLRNHLPNFLIDTTQAVGFSPDFLEAMMIAWLASQAMSNTVINLRSITGAKRSGILGVIYPAGRHFSE